MSFNALFGYEKATVADADGIAARIHALRDHTARTGFRTNRSQTDILGRLKPEVLAEVLLTLQEIQGGAR